MRREEWTTLDHSMRRRSQRYEILAYPLLCTISFSCPDSRAPGDELTLLASNVLVAAKQLSQKSLTSAVPTEVSVFSSLRLWLLPCPTNMHQSRGAAPHKSHLASPSVSSPFEYF
eukprot:386429-Pleurochrysis_carterae.AAC.1